MEPYNNINFRVTSEAFDRSRYDQFQNDNLSRLSSPLWLFSLMGMCMVRVWGGGMVGGGWNGGVVSKARKLRSLNTEINFLDLKTRCAFV